LMHKQPGFLSIRYRSVHISEILKKSFAELSLIPAPI
jgi:hypothetical protein